LKAVEEIPPYLEEYRWLISFVDESLHLVERLCQLQSETQKELDALLPSILDKAFKGEL
jgi:type I restriction enzyme S subunit